MPKKTTEQFQDEVKGKCSYEFTVLGEYKSNKTKILMKHNMCGREFLAIPVLFLRKPYCKHCSAENSVIKQRKTPEQYEKEFYEAFGDEYKVMEPYVNKNTKLSFLHNVCGHIFRTVPYKVACPICGQKEGKKKQTKTNEYFSLEIKELVGSEYKVLSPYINAIEKVEFKHSLCGHIFQIKPNNFLNGQRCPKCKLPKSSSIKTQTTTIKLSREQTFLEKMKEKYGLEYSVLSKYIDKNTEIRIKHEACGEEFSIKPSNAIHKGTKTLCQKCKNEYLKELNLLTHEKASEKIESILGGDYEVRGKYESYEKPISLFHKSCGRIFEKSLSSIVKNGACTHCRKEAKLEKERKTQVDFEKEVRDSENGNIVVLGQYVNRATKIKFFHKECGKEYFATPAQFTQGQRCPYCSESKGEKFIRYWLEENNLSYTREFSFPDCRDKRELLFDFKVDLNQNQEFVLLEYDGLQHFEKTEFFGGQEGFERTQRSDKIKNEYCKTKEIPLYRFRYDLSFEELEKQLEKIFLKK